jgi:hypothetical protein
MEKTILIWNASIDLYNVATILVRKKIVNDTNLLIQMLFNFLFWPKMIIVNGFVFVDFKVTIFVFLFAFRGLWRRHQKLNHLMCEWINGFRMSFLLNSDWRELIQCRLGESPSLMKVSTPGQPFWKEANTAI